MTFEFRLPDLGEGMAEVEIIGWHVQVGDTVNVDQPLVSIETDKFTTDIPSPVSGEVMELRGQPGETIPVGHVLLVLDVSDGVALPNAAAQASDGVVTAEVSETAAPGPPQAAATAARSPTSRVKAAPAVRALAVAHNIALDEVSGSGPGGRVTRDDVLAASSAQQSPVAGSPDRTDAVYEPGERVPLSGLRRQIAHNLVQSWTRIPQAVDFREVDASRLVEARQDAASWATGGPAPTFVAMIVKIAVVALQRHPFFNSKLDEELEEIVIGSEINIGVATATPRGIVVPVLHHADQKSISDITGEIEDLAARARARTLTGADMAGGSFTVNNIGALSPKGGAFPTPLINWPEVAILGFGRITDRVLAVDGRPAVRPTMLLTVTGDHRLVDGADIAAFTNDIVDLIEEPYRLLGGLR